VAVNSPAAALSLNLRIARSLSHQHFGPSAASRGSPPGLMPQFQKLLDEFCTYTKGYSSEQVSQSVTVGKFEGGMNVGRQRELVRSKARTKSFWFRRSADVFCESALVQFYRRFVQLQLRRGKIGDS
jgi:hypothetical protein